MAAAAEAATCLALPLILLLMIHLSDLCLILQQPSYAALRARGGKRCPGAASRAGPLRRRRYRLPRLGGPRNSDRCCTVNRD